MATIAAAPIVNGGIGAKLASARNRPVRGAKLVATLAPIIVFVATSAGLAWANMIAESTGEFSGWSWLPVGIFIVGSSFVAFAWAGRQTGTSRYGLLWLFGFLSTFATSFFVELVLGAAVILGGFAPFYLLLPVAAITGAVVWRRNLLTKILNATDDVVPEDS